jgi:predicted PurR-regulated permease PerM
LVASPKPTAVRPCERRAHELIFLAFSTPEGPGSVSGAPNAVNQIEGDVLAPAALGRAVSLHPMAILLALTGGAIVAGILGALLAVPITAVVWTAIKAWAETGRDEGGVARARPTWSGS